MNQTIKTRIEKISNGEVPDGYEKVSFGVFPCDWEKDKTLGDLFDFSGGLGKSREELGDEGVPYLHYGDMHRGSFNKVSFSNYLNLPKYETVIQGNESYLMRDGDIAFLDASEDLEGTSRAVLIDNVENQPFIAGLHTFVAKEKSIKFSKFYKQYITLPKEVYKQFRELAVGFKVYGLNRNTIKWINIAYPTSSQEQAKIAEVLMKWDEMVEAQDSYIKALELRKKALMQKLLTPKEEWQKTTLGNVCNIIMGQSPDSKCYNTERVGMPLIQGNADISNRIVKHRQYTSQITKIAKANSIIMTVRAPVGYVAYTDYSCCIGRGVCSIEIDGKFIYYLLLLKENSWEKLSTGSTFDSITGIELKKLRIRLPIKVEQQRIANILSTADEEVQLQKQKLDKIKQQRKSLQQLLLTGIVRVNYA